MLNIVGTNGEERSTAPVADLENSKAGYFPNLAKIGIIDRKGSRTFHNCCTFTPQSDLWVDILGWRGWFGRIFKLQVLFAELVIFIAKVGAHSLEELRVVPAQVTPSCGPAVHLGLALRVNLAGMPELDPGALAPVGSSAPESALISLHGSIQA